MWHSNIKTFLRQVNGLSAITKGWHLEAMDHNFTLTVFAGRPRTGNCKTEESKPTCNGCLRSMRHDAFRIKTNEIFWSKARLKQLLLTEHTLRISLQPLQLKARLLPRVPQCTSCIREDQFAIHSNANLMPMTKHKNSSVTKTSPWIKRHPNIYLGENNQKLDCTAGN